MPHQLRSRIYWDSDREKLLPEGHEDSAYLFAGPGTIVNDDVAEKYDVASLDSDEYDKHADYTIRVPRAAPSYVPAEESTRPTGLGPSSDYEKRVVKERTDKALGHAPASQELAQGTYRPTDAEDETNPFVTPPSHKARRGAAKAEAPKRVESFDKK